MRRPSGQPQVACHGGVVLNPKLDQRMVNIDGVNREDRKGRQANDLNSYSILEGLTSSSKQAWVKTSLQSNDLNRAMGAMVGMAVGDALGHPLEFLPACDDVGKPYFDFATMTFHEEFNKFNLKRGQWTDDAAMGLCMADSLILKSCFDGSDMRIRFWCWWNRGYNNAFRKDQSRSGSVGLGGNISKSLDAISNVKIPSSAFEAKGEDAGNGSLMRFAPIAIFFKTAPLQLLHDCSRKSSYTTHPGIMAAEACALLGHLIVRALQLPPGPVDVHAFLENAVDEYSVTSGLGKKQGWGYDQMRQLVKSSPVNATEMCWNWKSESLNIAGTLKARGRTYNGYPVDAGYFGSFCLDGLAMALWAVYHSTSFDDAIVRSINLCGDADSHGSIAGQLAGAIYGYSTINPKFIGWLRQWDDNDFAVRALLLRSIGEAGMPGLC